MSKKSRIEQLEKRIAKLEKRIATLEARPVFPLYWEHNGPHPVEKLTYTGGTGDLLPAYGPSPLFTNECTCGTFSRCSVHEATNGVAVYG